MKKFFAFFLVILVFSTNVFAKRDASLPFGEKVDSSLSALQSSQVGKVRITVFGGEELDVPFLTHIPTLSVFVNIQPDKSVVITERLILVLAEQQSSPFVRSYPRFYKDALGIEHENKMDFLWASYNNKTSNPKIRKTDAEIQIGFFEQETSSSGVHLFELSYVIPNALSLSGDKSTFFQPLLGSFLTYPSERIQILLAYPPEMTLSKAELLFGTNNKANEEAYDVYTDQDNHLIYKVKAILPEKIDIRMNVAGDAKGIDPVQPDEKIEQELNLFGWMIISLICIIIMFLYFYFTAQDVRDNMQNSKYLSKMRSKFSYDISMLRWVLLHKADARALFAIIIHFLQKGLISIRFDENGQIILTRLDNVKVSGYEKNMLSFFFPGMKKERKLSTWIFDEKTLKKFKKLILQNIYQQKIHFVLREVLIGALLPLIAVLVSIYLSYDVYQIVAELLILFVGYMFMLNYFVRKAKLDILIKQLFEEYMALSLNENKQREIDVVLEKGNHSNDEALLIILRGKRLSLTDFEKMFFAQIRY